MANSKLKDRKDIPVQDKWDIESMYSSEDQWEKDVEDAVSAAEKILSYQGRLGESPSVLAAVLSDSDSMEISLERAYTYARMKLDEDNGLAVSQERHDKAVSTLASVSAMLSFVTPELTAIPSEKLLSFIDEEPALEKYRHLLTDLIRMKEHVLSKEEENLLAQLSEVLGGPGHIFTMLNDADLEFEDVSDSEGNILPLTHGNYVSHMRSRDRVLRKNAYNSCYTRYKEHNNTLATSYNYNVKTSAITSRIKRYDSTLDSALSSDMIPESVYHNLIDRVHHALPHMYDYMEVRKNLLGYEKMYMYDVYVPIIDVPEREYTFEEAVELCNLALAPLGQDYLLQFNKGIEQRWIDRYENKGKTSGAYSFGSYDSYPFVLMNFNGKLEDVFTLIHEMGHSLHSFYTRANQPFVYGGHSIFTAEVASTVNESLLMKYMLDQEKDPAMRNHILNLYIEAFRTTLFRQTMFAEFELETHRIVEEGGALTSEGLNQMYDELNSLYFGPSVSHDDMIQYEWSRIPHFYRDFYVYQYATGYSAATAISEKILREGDAARDDYLRFLCTGASDYPVELLKIAGVDMGSPEPVERAMDTFADLVKELKGSVSK